MAGIFVVASLNRGLNGMFKLPKRGDRVVQHNNNVVPAPVKRTTSSSSAASGATAAAAVAGVMADLRAVLVSRPNGGVLSGRALGNSANISLWTDSHLQRLHEGIELSRTLFYPEFKSLPVDFRRLLLCNCAQESTGDYRLNVVPIVLDDHRSQGLIQVTPGSVVKDYVRFGQVIRHPAQPQRVLLDPQTVVRADLADPLVSLLLWAWYTRNSLVAGVSLNEWIHRVQWNIPTGRVTRDFGNCQLTWLAGPHNDRHTNGRRAFQDYWLRMKDYWVQARFGTGSRFDSLLKTRIENKMVLVKDATSAAP